MLPPQAGTAQRCMSAGFESGRRRGATRAASDLGDDAACDSRGWLLINIVDRV